MPNNIEYNSIKESESLIFYITKGIFEFKGFEFDITEAKFLADSIGDILSGESYLISKRIGNLDDDALKICIQNRRKEYKDFIEPKEFKKIYFEKITKGGTKWPQY